MQAEDELMWGMGRGIAQKYKKNAKYKSKKAKAVWLKYSCSVFFFIT